MIKICIDDYTSGKSILYLILQNYKSLHEDKFVLYSIKQDYFLMMDVINQAFPDLYALRKKIYVRALFPLCLITDSDYRISFFDNKISGYVSRSTDKKHKECLSCSKYDNCIGYIGGRGFKVVPSNQSSHLISWKEYAQKLTLLSNYLKDNLGLKNILIRLKFTYFPDLNLDDMIDIEGFKYIYLNISGDQENNFKGKFKNLFTHNNTEFILEVSEKYGFKVCFTSSNGFDEAESNIIDMGKYSLFFLKEYSYIGDLSPILENIFIEKKVDINGMSSQGESIGGYSGELIFLKMEDIHNIDSDFDFDKYIVYVNDNISYYIPEIYYFPYYITQSYNPITHFAIIAREYHNNIMYDIPYDFLLNLNSGARLYVDYSTGHVKCISN